MTTELTSAKFYNEIYKQSNYFSYHRWLYAPYIASLVAFCGLKKGNSVLDVGCGQGFFSYHFSKLGMKVHGIDVSETGIQMAEKMYGRFGVTFAVSDIQTATFSEAFDCIFVRSCSLYNTDTFAIDTQITDKLLGYLRVDGVFIFVYNSSMFSKPSAKWRYHSLDDMRSHFRRYPCAQMFFLNKITPFLLHKYSFTSINTHFSVFLSRVLGMGGDLVCVLKSPYLASGDSAS
jgi:SAM-dependent methyltransferase